VVNSIDNESDINKYVKNKLIEQKPHAFLSLSKQNKRKNKQKFKLHNINKINNWPVKLNYDIEI
jgi:hypothetical protein